MTNVSVQSFFVLIFQYVQTAVVQSGQNVSEGAARRTAHDPARIRPMRIADIEGCSIIPGRSTFRYRRENTDDEVTDEASKSPKPECLILRPAAIMDGYIDMAALESDPEFRPPDDGPFTQAGDIIQETMTPFAAAYVGPGEGGVFVPNSCCVIRLQGKALDLYDPMFIVGYLNLTTVNEALRRRASGPRGTTLRKSTLENFVLPDTPIERQREIGQLVNAHIEQQRTRRALAHIEDKIILASYSPAQEEVQR